MKTAVERISIFKLKSGVSYNKEDPNYDLFELACRVSAKTLYPNFLNLDATYNAELYVDGRPETEIATMGCVEYSETITYKVNEKIYKDVKIGDAYNHIEKHFNTVIKNKNSTYIKTKGLNVKVWDSYKNDFVEVYGFIKNSCINKGTWRTIEFTNGYKLTATHDHPLPVEGKGRTYVEKLEIGDTIKLSKIYMDEHKLDYDKVEVACITMGISEDKDEEFSYDLETESDRLDISFIQSHNCRTRVGKNVYDPDKSVTPGRGNLSFTSINLPRLAIKSKGDIKTFYKLLDEMLELVHDQLLERFEVQCMRHMINHPFLLGQGNWLGSDRLGPKDDIRAILKHGTMAVGFIGLAETLVALTGKHHGESEEAQKLGLEIIGHMRKMTDAWSEEEKMNYGIIGTPGEGLSGRFVNIDKEKYGIIKGVTDKDYYTNSSHVPVWYNISAFKKIQIEAPYHEIENGGHILYIELDGDPSKNLKAFKKIIQCMHDNNAGYFAINHPLDRDPVCGYKGVIGDTCPRCGRREGEAMTMDMWIKIKGYAGAGNADTLGYHGNPDEEEDRLPNTLDNIENTEFERG